MNNIEGTKDNHMKWALRVFIIAILDSLVVITGFVSGFLLRFEFTFYPITHEYREMLLTIVPIFAAVVIAVMYIFKLYHSIWRFASIHELGKLVMAWMVLIVLSAAYISIDHSLYGYRRIP